MARGKTAEKLFVAAAKMRQAGAGFDTSFWCSHGNMGDQTRSRQTLAFDTAAEALEALAVSLLPADEEPYVDGGEAVIAAANFNGG